MMTSATTEPTEIIAHPDPRARIAIGWPSPARLVRDRTRSYSSSVMQRVMLGAMVAGALGGGLGGFAVARSRAVRSPGDHAAEVVPPRSFDAWIARALARSDEPIAREHAVAELAASPGLRPRLLAHYGDEPNRHRRAVLRELLLGAFGADLGAEAYAMAAREDRRQRAAGFELLARLGPSEATFALARQRVLDETDGDALAGALAAFVPMIKPSLRDAAPVIPRLLELARHPLAVVRAHAVQRVADWDLSGTLATPIAQAGLADPDRRVRQAAVGAVQIGALRDEGIKAGLFRILRDADERLATRAAALQALERFPLTEDEHATYLAARVDVETRGGRS